MTARPLGFIFGISFGSSDHGACTPQGTQPCTPCRMFPRSHTGGGGGGAEPVSAPSFLQRVLDSGAVPAPPPPPGETDGQSEATHNPDCAGGGPGVCKGAHIHRSPARARRTAPWATSRCSRRMQARFSPPPLSPPQYSYRSAAAQRAVRLLRILPGWPRRRLEST